MVNSSCEKPSAAGAGIDFDGAWVASPARGDALLVVDLQRDFLPGGTRALAAAPAALAAAERHVMAFAARLLPVIAVRDWHPRHHCSFVEQGGAWPVHCVAGSTGAMFPPTLCVAALSAVVSKGVDANRDPLSAFEDTALEQRLRAVDVGRLFVGGLTTDHGIVHTVIDARALGFEVVVLCDAIAGIDLHAGDSERALARMRKVGAQLLDGAAVLGQLA